MRIELQVGESASLKAKRKEVSSLKAQLQQRFGASVAEVAHQDLWQRSTFALTMVGGNAADLEHRLDAVERFLGERFPETLRTTRKIVSFEDLDV